MSTPPEPVHQVVYKRVAPASVVLVAEDAQPMYGCKTDPRHTDDEYEYYCEPGFKHRVQVLETECGYHLWQDPLWSKHVRWHVPCAQLNDDSIPYDEKESTDDEWADFAALIEDGEYDTNSGEFTYGNVSDASYREHHALRLLYTFLLEHNLDAMAKLIELDYAHVGSQLFPFVKHFCFEGGSGAGAIGCRQSLLGMAIVDVENADAVKMLCDRGANPNGMLNRMGCAIEGPQFGISALAQQHLDCHADGSPHASLMPLLKALLEAGADPIDGICDFEDQSDAQSLCLTYAEVRRVAARQRWHNVLAMVALVAFWRHAAASPDSKAATRNAKRFKSLALMEEGE